MNTSTPDRGDQNQAAAVFATIMTAAGGFAGLALAGVVLALDYMVHGEPHERDEFAQRAADRRRNRYEDAMAWLDNDRAERQRHREATRSWFAEDPTTRGDKPSSGETVGKALARVWNNLLVGASRAGRGWKKGRDEARERLDAGTVDWWKRPDADKPAEADPVPAAVPPEPSPTPPPAAPTGPDVVDAEIVSDVEPAGHEVVPVGQDGPQRPDESVDEYRRRLEDLEDEVQQNRSDHHPDPALN